MKNFDNLVSTVLHVGSTVYSATLRFYVLHVDSTMLHVGSTVPYVCKVYSIARMLCIYVLQCMSYSVRHILARFSVTF